MSCLFSRAALALALLTTACAPLSPPLAPPRTAAACAAASALNPASLAPGLGGTGAVAEADPGGIGGTGRMAREGTGLGGTGIVGVVTGFASVCVNGVEVEVEPDVPVRRNGDDASLRDLEVGHVVLVQADGAGEAVRARRIELLDAAVGPIAAIDAPRREIAVLGQRVQVLSPTDLAGLRLGDWVRVSGHRAPDAVRASRVQRLAAEAVGPAQSLGAVDGDASRGWRVGGTPVRWSRGMAPPPAGESVLVRGEWDGRVLAVSSLTPAPLRGATRERERVVLQGYLHRFADGEVSLGYESVRLQDNTRVLGGALDALRVGQPLQVEARWAEGQRLVAERIQLGREGGRGVRSSGESGDDSGHRSRNRNRGGDDSGGDDNSGSGSSGGDDSGSGSSGSGSSGGDGSGRGRGRGRGS